MKGARFFITGATGFYGKWILESIISANDRLGTNITATLLSRDPTHFKAEVPHLAARPEFDWLIGDMVSFAFPKERYDYVFHFATTPAAKLGAGEAALILENIAGTERVLRFAREAGVKRLLYASSGAVYGRQPPALSHIPEDYAGAPRLNDPMSAYGETKRMSELMCATAPGIECVIARGFAFVGPHLPLTDKFAIGSFIRDALAGGPVRVHSNGRPVRSYLYAADLAIWLLTLLVRGRPRTAYNVGSGRPLSIGELAAIVAAQATPPARTPFTSSSEVATEPPDVYVPCIDRATAELGLHPIVDIAAGIARTMAWGRTTLESSPS